MTVTLPGPVLPGQQVTVRLTVRLDPTAQGAVTKVVVAAYQGQRGTSYPEESASDTTRITALPRC